MADPLGSSMHQRRQYDAPGAGYAPQHYYQPYMPPYGNYQGQAMSPYQQQIPPQQWQYYQGNYYQRQQHAYAPMNSYPYAHPGAYQARPVPPPMHSPYAVPARPIPGTPQSQAGHMPPSPYQDPQAHIGPPPSPPVSIEFSGHRAPYYPPLPWLSVPDTTFPPRQARSRRRPRSQSASHPVELPTRSNTRETQRVPDKQEKENGSNEVQSQQISRPASPIHTEASAVSQLQSDRETVSSSTTHATAQDPAMPTKQALQHSHRSSVVVPVIPNLPVGAKSNNDQPKVPIEADADPEAKPVANSEEVASGVIEAVPEAAKAAPKSWAELLRDRNAAAANNTASPPTASNQNQDSARNTSELLGHAIANFAVQKPNPNYKLSFLEPRGLINSGNMCYMNSILQVLVFCVPFYNLLSHVGRNAIYSFKSDTPLLDALIMFMREFAVIDAADSLEKLRLRLKPAELDQFGDPLLPEYVYEEIRRMPRFATMQRGHQQDAEEFLGFLFEELQGECAKAIQKSGLPLTSNTEVLQESNDANDDEDGWLEVGPKQKASTTRSSGSIEVDTPINRIFGGQLRSEFRVPGAKNSVTLEPYQSIQLDIGSPEIRNIVDALKGLTKPETLHGDFQSPRGTGVTATKQVFIESLPPILILHLKRFQYDNTGGTQKIWRKIGYPLELEIPKEAFPHTKRGGFAVRGGLPKYRLISVIYHHGKSATAGHYTTDILRQDSREWLRVDDTYIRKVRSQDVEAGSEEDPKVLAAALEQHRKDEAGAGNSFDVALGEDGEATQTDKGWSQAKSGGKKWSGVVNGTAKSSGRATPVGPQSLKDNKVAYILFYERIET